MTAPSRKPPPEFRPRTKRQRPKRRIADPRLVMTVAALGVVLIAAAAFAFLLLRSDDGTKTAAPGQAPSQSTGGTVGGPDPTLPGPASAYAPSLTEAPAGYQLRDNKTYSLTPLQFVADNSALFPSTEEGERTVEQWGFASGYQVELWPIGQLAEVVSGPPIYTVGVYLFDTTAGARLAFEKFEEAYGSLPGSHRVEDAHPLANQSSAWAYPEGTVGVSDVEAIFHRFIFRRGNMVVTSQTLGGVPFMNIDKAREMARIVDDRALGDRPATTPTPAPTIPGYIPPTPTP